MADGVVPTAARQATDSCMAAAASTPRHPRLRFRWRLLAPSRCASRSGPLRTADAVRRPRPILPAVSARHGPCPHSVERGMPCFDLRLIGTPTAAPVIDPILLGSPRAIQHRRGAVGCPRRPNWRTTLAKSGSPATSLLVPRSPAADVPPERAGQTAASMLRRSPWWEDGRNTTFRGTGDWLMIAWDVAECLPASWLYGENRSMAASVCRLISGSDSRLQISRTCRYVTEINAT